MQKIQFNIRVGVIETIANEIGHLYIHPPLQFHSHLKIWQLLRLHRCILTSLRIAPGVRFVFPDMKRAQPADLDSITLFQDIGHSAEKQLDTFGGFEGG